MEAEDSVGEDGTSLSELDHETESLRQANVNSLLKIAQLQAQIEQLRNNLALKGKEIEGCRRRVKGELTVGRRMGPIHMSSTAIQDIISFISLLEDENKELRTLSSIPVEIEKLKSELSQMNQWKQSCDLRFHDLLSPEITAGTQYLLSQIPAETIQLRSELADLQQKLTEETVSRTHLEDTVVPGLERNKADLEREIALLRSELTNKGKDEDSLISFKSNFHGQFNKEENAGKFPAPASPATRSIAQSKSGPMSARLPQKTGSTKGKKQKTRGYSPTFLRVLKAKKPPRMKTQVTSPEPPFGQTRDDVPRTSSPGT